jgi:hypothetical protein
MSLACGFVARFAPLRAILCWRPMGLFSHHRLDRWRDCQLSARLIVSSAPLSHQISDASSVHPLQVFNFVAVFDGHRILALQLDETKKLTPAS